MGGGAAFLVIILIVFVLWLLSSLKVINQYQRAIVLTLGKYTGMRQPGWRIVWAGFQRAIVVDVRSTPVDIPKQEVITKDNVTVGVDAVVYLRAVDPAKAVLETTNYIYATTQFAQAALRDVTGNVELDDLLAKRDEISQQIKEIVDKQTEPWGVDVETVKVQNIELPEDMKRAMAKQAEAERERRAQIINAEGEKAAATTLADAAKILTSNPASINLRTLNTLERISADPSQKITVLMPTDLLNAISSLKK
jgi:regulator of protease activity HflC (stomatin/prohibitin superfamily)